MAISVSLLTSNYDNTDDTSSPYTRTTASISPAANSLIVALFGDTETAVADVGNATFSGLSLTWTQVEGIADLSNTYAASAHWAQCGASPGSGTLTATIGTTTTGTRGSGWAILQVTGHNTVTPVRNHNSATSNSGTTASVTLGSAGNSNNRVIGWSVHAANTATTPKTNWTELSDNAGTTPNFGSEASWRSDIYEAAYTSTWTTSSIWCAVALEIVAATATASLSPTNRGMHPALLVR